MFLIIANIRDNIHLAIKDSLDTNVSKICAKCKQSKCHKLKQIFSLPLKILMIIIKRDANNNRKLNNVMCITESINIDSYHANLKTFIQHYRSTQNEHYTSVIKKGNTWYHWNDNQIKETNLNQEINDVYFLINQF